jgi:hypothetical protein
MVARLFRVSSLAFEPLEEGIDCIGSEFRELEFREILSRGF